MTEKRAVAVATIQHEDSEIEVIVFETEERALAALILDYWTESMLYDEDVAPPTTVGDLNRQYDGSATFRIDVVQVN